MEAAWETPHTIPETFRIRCEERTFAELYADFAATDHGRRLAENLRFDRFRPDHVSGAEWQRLLGRDVNNLTHLQVTYQLTRGFFRRLDSLRAPAPHLQFDYEERRQLLFTALVHDWAEAVVGDISYDQKTSDDEDLEWQILGEMTRDLGPAAGAKTLEILQDTDSKLGAAFNVIERLGYFRTADRAWRTADALVDTALATNLRWLTQNVLANQGSALCASASEYPPVAEVLAERQATLSDAYGRIDDELIGQPGETSAPQYVASRADWLEYVAGTP